MTKFIKVLFSISCMLALVKTMNDMGSLSFKCIFDPAKTITKIVPGILIIQHAYEYDNKYATNLQAVDCFINVASSTIINKKVEEITQEFETRDLKIAEEPLNDMEYNEDVEKREANEVDNTVDGKGLQKRKLKRVINTKDGAAMEIYYRSIAEDKQFKQRHFTKVTKIISSKKATQIIVNARKTHENNTLKGILSLRKRTAFHRSINEDKLFKTKNFTKITKRLKSRFIEENITLAQISKHKFEGVVEAFCDSKSVDCDSEKCYKKAPIETVYKKSSKEVFEEHDASNNVISTIATIESDYKKPSKELFEENKPNKIRDSIENNNILDPSSSELSAKEILDEKPKNLLFDKINPDALMENILFHPRVIYA
ncbi:uncharacterized protein LOC105217505 [Zeugodacus cucurbitae]|uniref:uncharacterized protein LOC105217505 n=1 Tax=Zeugodacus cucurbitae TaxID=28588 RepID=UPI0005968DF9|nr:uncharacterized protein LOC105217505 [Zeugodacus cucurbitae]